MKKILVIDGNVEYKNMMLEALQREQRYEIRMAADGKTGLKLVREFQPDLVAVEMFLPDLNGLHVIHEMKADPSLRSTSVVVLTSALIENFEEGKGFRIGADRYFSAEGVLQKPFDADDFLDKIEEVLLEEKKERKSSKEKILIVDDDPAIHNLMEFLLSKAGYENAWAPNGKVGLEMIESERPDLVFLDLMMPEMSGTEMLKRTMEKYPDLPVIMVTAHGSENKAVELMKSGASDYIRKPFNNDEVLLKARDVLRKARLLSMEKKFNQRLAETTHYLVSQQAKIEQNPYGLRHIILTFFITLFGSLLGLYLSMWMGGD